LDGVYTEKELEMARKMWPGHQKKNLQTNPRPKKNKNDLRCKTCKGASHGMVTSKECKCRLAWKAWRATKPKRGEKFVAPIEEANNIESDDEDNRKPAAIDVDAAQDTPDLQLRRDTEECDNLDSMDLDCADDSDLEQFFDAHEHDDVDF